MDISHATVYLPIRGDSFGEKTFTQIILESLGISKDKTQIVYLKSIVDFNLIFTCT